MEVIKYNPTMMKEWDTFVEGSVNGTLFHKQKFLSYHSNRFYDLSFMFYKNEELVAVFPCTRKDNYMWSHCGSSFGGIVVKNNLSLESHIEIIGKIVDIAKANKYKGIWIRTSPYIYHTTFADTIDYILSSLCNFNYKTELSSVIDLNNFTIKDSAKRSINKANKHLHIIHNDNNFDDYWPILERNIKDKFNTNPTHTISEILKLKSFFPNDINLVSVYYKDKMVAGIVLFGTKWSGVREVFYIAQDYAYQEYRPINLLIADTIAYSLFDNMKYLNLGLCTENSGENINISLYNFKHSLGARGVLKRTYYKDF